MQSSFEEDNLQKHFMATIFFIISFKPFKGLNKDMNQMENFSILVS